MKTMKTTKAFIAIVTFVMLTLFGVSLFKALLTDVNVPAMVTYGVLSIIGAAGLMVTDDEEVEEEREAP